MGKKGLTVYLELMFTLFSHLYRRMQIFCSLVQIAKTISKSEERSYNFTGARTDGQEGPLTKYTSVRLRICVAQPYMSIHGQNTNFAFEL